MYPHKRKRSLIDLTEGYNRVQKSQKPNTTDGNASQTFGARQEPIDLTQAEPSTQAELDDERIATELVDSTQGLDEAAYVTYELYGTGPSF